MKTAHTICLAAGAAYPPLLQVGGLSVLIRALLVLKHNGLSDLTVVAMGDKDALEEEVRREPRLKETRILDVAAATSDAAEAGGDFLLVLADRVFSPEVAGDLISANPAENKSLLLLDEGGGFSGLAFCRAACGAEVAAALKGTGDPAGRLERAIRPADRQSLSRGFIERIRSAADARRAEDRLLRGLVSHAGARGVIVNATPVATDRRRQAKITSGTFKGVAVE